MLTYIYVYYPIKLQMILLENQCSTQQRDLFETLETDSNCEIKPNCLVKIFES